MKLSMQGGDWQVDRNCFDKCCNVMARMRAEIMERDRKVVENRGCLYTRPSGGIRWSFRENCTCKSRRRKFVETW